MVWNVFTDDAERASNIDICNYSFINIIFVAIEIKDQACYN